MNLNDGYLGRVLGLVISYENFDGFAFKFGGRSKLSKDREFVRYENRGTVQFRSEPLDKNESFDTNRHYVAVMVDKETGLLIVSNGYHTENIFNAYMNSDRHTEAILRDILDKLGPEDDKLKDGTPVNTPRIAGVISYNGHINPDYYLGIVRPVEVGKREPWITKAIQVEPKTEELVFVSTYNGKENEKGVPLPFELDLFTPEKIPTVKLPFVDGVLTPEILARYLFESCDQRFVAGTISGINFVSCGGNNWEFGIKSIHGERRLD